MCVLNAFRHLRILHGDEVHLNQIVFQCSTPFGIFEFFTVPAPLNSPALISAQRLSASSNSSRWTHPTTRGIRSSAQRLSASSNSSRPRVDERQLLKVRAQRLSASSNSSQRRFLRWPAARQCACSTPFGIFEFFTRFPYLSSFAPSCAQRLSASSNSSHIGMQACKLVVLGAQRLSASSNSSHKLITSFGIGFAMCSTPFGIFEFFTALFCIYR